MKTPDKYVINDNGKFPGNKFPALHYKQAVDLPLFLPAHTAKSIFHDNGWTNNWRSGIYTYHHYHSNTHEAICVVKGTTAIQLGGDDGVTLHINQGDVIIIPAGVAHKNLGHEHNVVCVGGYPDGADYDMNYGKPDERPQANLNIAALPIPIADPVFGALGLPEIWPQYLKDIPG